MLQILLRAGLAGLIAALVFNLVFRFAMDPAPIYPAPVSWRALVSPGTHAGKVALVTGGNTGIGFETVKALTYAGMRVAFTSRSRERGDQAAHKLNGALKAPLVTARPLDLSNLRATRDFAHWLATDYLPSVGAKHLDVVVLNAAYNQGGEAYQTNANGWEMTAAANHFGNVYLVNALRDSGLLHAQSRVVVVTSHLHALFATDTERLRLPDDLLWSRATMESKWPVLNAMEIYANTKTANVLWARQLAKRGVFAVAVHPGLIATDLGTARPDVNASALERASVAAKGMAALLWKHSVPFCKDAAQGAATQVWAALSKDVAPGGYYRDVAAVQPSRAAQDDTVGSALWDWTAQQLASAVA